MADVAEHFDEGELPADPVEFTCECGIATCTEKIALTLVEYGAVRAVPTHFAVFPGHEVPEIERVVEWHTGYLVVAKQDDGAEEIARETDPRT